MSGLTDEELRMVLEQFAYAIATLCTNIRCITDEEEIRESTRRTEALTLDTLRIILEEQES